MKIHCFHWFSITTHGRAGKCCGIDSPLHVLRCLPVLCMSFSCLKSMQEHQKQSRDDEIRFKPVPDQTCNICDLAPEGMTWYWHFIEICAHLALLIWVLCDRNHCMKCYSKRETVMDGSLFFTVWKFFDFPWRTIKLSAVNWSGISKITHFKIHRTFNRNSKKALPPKSRSTRVSIENPMYFEMWDFRNST